MSRNMKLFALVATFLVVGFTSADAALRTVTGRVTAYTTNSITVLDRETVTLRLDARTAFTKMITQKPWQEDIHLNVRALRVGHYVAVHVRRDDPATAAWVQMAADMRPLPAPVLLMPGRPGKSTVPAPTGSPDVLSKRELETLITNAETRADHVKLAKHFAAVADRYDAEATEHEGMAKAYRARPTSSETKRPGMPDTAVHCERLSQLAKTSANEARALAQEHRRMADAVK